MLMYTVTLVENPVDGELKTIFWKINNDEVFRDEVFHKMNMLRLEEELDVYGTWRIRFFLQTTDRSAMLSARIKCECAEFRQVLETHNKILKNSRKSPEALNLCKEVQKVYLERIGKLVGRLLVRAERYNEDIREIKDEIALQAYDLVCKEDEAISAYEKLDRELNKAYYYSKVNAYC